MNRLNVSAPSDKQKLAKWCGILYLSMMPFAIISLGIRFGFFDHNNVLVTITNIKDSELIFRLASISWFIQNILFILLALNLYRLFLHIDQHYARMMLVFSIASVPVLFLNELFQYAAIELVSGANYLSAIPESMLNAYAIFFLKLNEQGIGIVHVFWGVWLFPLGMLVFRSNFIPPIIAILLFIGGCGYLIDALLSVMFPFISLRLTPLTFLAEIAFPLWLIFKSDSIVVSTQE